MNIAARVESQKFAQNSLSAQTMVATALAREYILEEDMETTHAEYGQNDSMPSKSYTWCASLVLNDFIRNGVPQS
eukprot:363385-Amphidinium_carterae.1